VLATDERQHPLPHLRNFCVRVNPAYASQPSCTRNSLEGSESYLDRLLSDSTHSHTQLGGLQPGPQSPLSLPLLSGVCNARRIHSGRAISAGIFEQSMGARNRVGIGLSYRIATLHGLPEWIPWNRFLGSVKVLKTRLSSISVARKERLYSGIS
jgi:hypothetical protein